MRASIVVSVVMTAACLFGFYEIADDVNTSEAIARFDQYCTAKIQSLRGPNLDFFMKGVTYAGGIIGVTVLTAIIFMVLRKMGRNDDANFTLALTAGGAILANILKFVLKRVRPESALVLISQPASSSFPSGHSMGSMCLAIATIEAIVVAPTPGFLIKVIGCALCAIYAILVGISRVYLGVHYPSDVIAAWLLAGAWISGATALNRVFLVGRFSSKP